MKKINAWINRDNDEESLHQIESRKNCSLQIHPPITYVDVERSFSTYKRILDDRGHNLLDILKYRNANYYKFQQIFGLIKFLSFFIDKFSFFFVSARNACR